jgi:nucleotide-binding universal stress UspA family protein
MLKEILIPMDGTPCSERAARVGLALARGLGSNVTLTHVIDQAAPFTTDLHQADEKRIAATLIEQWLNEAKRFGVQAASSVTSGPNVAEAISRMAEYGACDLIVMGTHGREGIPRAIWGSVAERVAHETSVPVVFVRCSESDFAHGISPEFARGTDHALGPKFERLLVPIDADQISLTAVAQAVELARQLKATLELMHVTINPENRWSELELRPVYNGKMLVETQRIMREALALIGRQLPGTESTGTESTGTESAGANQVELSELQGGLEAVNRVIVRHAKHSGADLIVMGTNARTGVLKWLVGSVAETVIHHSEVPVLLVRALEVKAQNSERTVNAMGTPRLEPNV